MSSRRRLRLGVVDSARVPDPANRLLLVPFPLPFPFPDPSPGPAEDEVPVLEGVELPGARLDPELLGDDAPAFALVGLVGVDDGFRGAVGHLAQLEDHEGVCRGGHRSEHRLHLRDGHPELGAHLGVEPGQVGPRLDIDAAQETVEAGRRDPRRATRTNRRSASTIRCMMTAPFGNGPGITTCVALCRPRV